MAATLKGKDLICTQDWTKDEIIQTLDLAERLKREWKANKTSEFLKNKTFLMIFYSTSTRTRNSFEAAMTQLGGHAHFLRPEEMQLSAGENIKDTAKVLERYGAGIGIRVFGPSVEFKYGKATELIEEYARWADIPVINMSSDKFHPCQVLADLMTIRERIGDLKGRRFVMSWAYNPRVRRPMCMANSLALLMTRFGMDFVLAHPKGYGIDPEVIRTAQMNAKNNGGRFAIETSMENAFQNADVVCALDWTMINVGEVGLKEDEKLRNNYKHWKVTNDLVKICSKNVYYIHPLPAIRGYEVDDEVIDGPHSIVYDQAENRLHIQKAVLSLVM
jgi:N-acetylornithine carbamoyltransferase